MVRETDRRPLRIVRVSFETTRFSAEHLVDAYARLVPMVRRRRLATKGDKISTSQITAMTGKRRRSEP
jgi:hypothetical protein